MKNILRLVVVSILFIFSGIATAAPYFTITKSSSVSFPSDILVGTQGIGDYLVTNISGRDQTVNVRNLPTGFSVATATGTSPANCGSSSLANGASCTLRLSYVSNIQTHVNQQLPVICPTSRYVTGCIYPVTATDFSVDTNPTSNMTTLSAPSELLLTPGQTTALTITNTGSVTANNVQITLPAELSEYLESSAVTQCASVSPADSCIFSLPMASELPTVIPTTSAVVAASNAQSLNVMVTIDPGLVLASNILFTTPGTQSITVTNQGVTTISQLSIQLGSGTNGVTQNGGTCGNDLAGGASCTYDFTATQDAHGNATATVGYTQNGISKTTTGTISVANTTLLINGGEEIEGSTNPPTGSFTIENTGNFDWQAPAVSRSTEDTWLTLDTSNCTNAAVLVGASCSVGYAITGLHDLSSVITASGSNASATSQNFVPDEYISIGIEGDSSDQHLSYKAVKVTNLTSLSETLSDISAAPPSGLSSKVTLCDATASNCGGLSAYASDCQNGTVLTAGTTCHLWYQANTNTSLSAATSSSVNVSVTATPISGGSANPLSRNISFTYDNVLYVGGGFLTAGGNSASRIAKWNGSAWSAFVSGGNNGVSSTVNALITLKGDLYAGGQFTSAGGTTVNNIAKWDGSSWSALGSGTNGIVFAFATFNGNLIIGGTFTAVSGVSNTNRTAKWNGSSWSALGSLGTGGGVNAFATLNGVLYAGGAFNQISPGVPNWIAQWDGNSSWLQVGSNLVGTVRSLTTLNGELYAGGDFTANGLNRVARWNGTTWVALGGTTNGGVYALNTLSTDVYAGGQFTTIGGNSRLRTAKWNGSSWGLAGNVSVGSFVNVFTPLNGALYVGGTFTEVLNGISPLSANNIGLLTGSTWSLLGTGTNGSVQAIVIAPSLTLT